MRRLELLLARSPAPALPVSAPPEAAYLVPSDFVALPAELAEHGFTADAAEPFGTTAARLVDRALADRTAVRIAVPAR